jgi:hypothetical protein
LATERTSVATDDHKIHAISRRLLDPRRPKRKPTSEEQEEMLIQYDPVIPDEPKLVISHQYEASSPSSPVFEFLRFYSY